MLPTSPSAASHSRRADWVSTGFNSLVKTLTVGSSSNSALSFIGGLWNSAVSLAQSAISNLASTLTAPVLGTIRRGLSAAALASWAVSALRNLKVATSAVPSFNQFAVDPSAGNSGGLTITLGKAGGFDFPPGLQQCASLGIDLPSFNDVGNDHDP
jgi:hypothetical protein